MIIDNKQQVNDPLTYDDHPLSVYLKGKYSYIGNILVDMNSSSTTLYMDLPYISRDAGVLFKIWFFDKLCELLKSISGQNFYISGDTIKQKILVKQTTESLIVENTIKKVCTFSKGKYFDRNNGTYVFNIIFPQEAIPVEMGEMIEGEFNKAVNLFRSRNNEDTF